MGKQNVDYINLSWVYHEKTGIKLTGHRFMDCYVLDVLFMNEYQFPDVSNEKQWKREIEKLERKLKKYHLHYAGIYMDPVIEAVMDKKGLAFDSRKQELLRNSQDIFQMLKGKKCRNRREILMVLEANWFTLKELELLLQVAKDIYEDITIFTENEKVLKSKAFAFMQNEWGVVVNKVSGINKLKSSYDSILYVVSRWKNIIEWNISCENGYVLSLEPLNDDIKTKIFCHNQEKKQWSHLYSGYHYVFRDKAFPYQMAVDLLNQHQNEKIKPTSIAIYEVKC